MPADKQLIRHALVPVPAGEITAEEALHPTPAVLARVQALRTAAIDLVCGNAPIGGVPAAIFRASERLPPNRAAAEEATENDQSAERAATETEARKRREARAARAPRVELAGHVWPDARCRGRWRHGLGLASCDAAQHGGREESCVW